MKPNLDQIDRTALSQAIAAGYDALPPDDRERLDVLADIQGGFPYDWQWLDSGIRVVWADVEIAFVPYELVLRPSANERAN